MNINKRAFV